LAISTIALTAMPQPTIESVDASTITR